MVRMRPEQFLPGAVKKLQAPQDHSESSRRSIQMLMWWISHQTLASVALLMLRSWVYIELLLIPLLIHSWMSLLRTFFLRAPINSTPSRITLCSRKYRLSDCLLAQRSFTLVLIMIILCSYLWIM